MSKRDYYEVLNVSRDANKKDIKQAYRKLARKHHPDANRDNQKEAEKRFKEISEAYEVLADDGKRERYNQFGHEGVNFGSGGFSWDQFTRAGDVSDIFEQMFQGGGLGDIFSQFFGGARRKPRNNRGNDLRYDMTISLEEAYRGLDNEITVPRKDKCPDCNGSGAGKDGTLRQCSQCNGQGMVRAIHRRGFMQTVTTNVCNKCGGDGKVIDKPCGKCSGGGIKDNRRKINVEIPPGVEDGQHLRLSGQGDTGPRGGAKGDLFVVISVNEDRRFERRGTEIGCRLKIGPVDAVLGKTVKVPTISGEVKLKIPPGTQPNTVLRMKGRGMPVIGRNNSFGDQHVEIDIEISKASGKNKPVWEELRKIEEQESESLISKAKRKLRGE